MTATTLLAGSYEVVAKVRDAAGNGTAVSQVLTVEVNPAPVNLRAAGSYAVLAASFIANTGTTVVNGDLGVNPGDVVSGFPPGIINGGFYVGDSISAAAQVDLLAAINEVSARTPHTEIVGDLAGRTFHIGVHHRKAALALTGTVTLDAEDDPDAIFIFQTDAAFDTAAGSSVILANGAQASNVYWVVDGAAGTGASTSLSGTILARGAITLGAGTVLLGRALTLIAVTLAGNTITNPGPIALGRQDMKSTVGSDLSVTANVTAPAPTDETTAPPPANSAATPSAETAPATQMVITTTGVSGTASSTATLGPVTVQARDSLGNPVTGPAGGITVTLSSTSTGTKVFAATPAGTGVTSVVIPAGASSVSFYYGDTRAGTPTLTAAGTGLSSATQTATLTVGAAVKLAFGQQPKDHALNRDFTSLITVLVVDQFGNPTTSTASIQLATGPGSPTGSLSGGADQTAVSGVATFPRLSISGGAQSSGVYTLQATGTGLTSATSNPFTMS